MESFLRGSDAIALAFVGPAVPPTADFLTPAYSRAGAMFIDNMLGAVASAGLPPSLVLSYLPIPAFPRANRLWIRPKAAMLDNGFRVHFLPFLNVTPLKQISLGLGATVAILHWGWRVRRCKRRLVWTFNLSVPPGLFTLLATRLVGGKLLVSLNDINEPGHTVPDRWMYRLDYALHRWLIPKLDGHIVVADQIMNDFAPGRPYLRVEGGVTSDMLNVGQRPCETEQRGDTVFTVTAAGSLDDANGIPEVIAAFRLLKEERFRLRILGGGPLEAYVRQAAAEDPRIDYAGVVPFGRVMEEYSTSDLLINMRITKRFSTKYFFPSKLMEYLASGVPVLTTCTGHVEEEFAPYCVLLRDESPAAVADAIQRVADMPPYTRAAIGERARVYMAAHKAWSIQGQRIAAYVRETMFGTAAVSQAKDPAAAASVP